MPPLSAAWFSDIVIPAVIVSIVVVVSLFAIVVLLLVLLDQLRCIFLVVIFGLISGLINLGVFGTFFYKIRAGLAYSSHTMTLASFLSGD